MLDIGSSELLLIVVVAVVVIGPKDLPRMLYKLGQLLGKGRAMTRHFRSGIDEMIRQAEMEEMEKKWAADNARIMAQSEAATPAALPSPDVAADPVPSHFVAESAPEPAPSHFVAESAPEPVPVTPTAPEQPAPAVSEAPTPKNEGGAPA